MEDIKVEDLDLSVGAYNLLKRSKINSLFEICKFDKLQLLSLQGSGSKAVNEIDKLVKSHGVKLGCKNFESPITKWEYCLYETISYISEYELNNFGSKGWQLVHIRNTNIDLLDGLEYLFKRQLKPIN